MKKFILFSILSVLLYSAPGHAGGEEGEDAELETAIALSLKQMREDAIRGEEAEFKYYKELKAATEQAAVKREAEKEAAAAKEAAKVEKTAAKKRLAQLEDELYAKTEPVKQAHRQYLRADCELDAEKKSLAAQLDDVRRDATRQRHKLKNQGDNAALAAKIVQWRSDQLKVQERDMDAQMKQAEDRAMVAHKLFKDGKISTTQEQQAQEKLCAMMGKWHDFTIQRDNAITARRIMLVETREAAAAAPKCAARTRPAEVEAARRQAASQEAARRQAASQEAARRQAASQEAARRQAASQEAARRQAAAVTPPPAAAEVAAAVTPPPPAAAAEEGAEEKLAQLKAQEEQAHEEWLTLYAQKEDVTERWNAAEAQTAAAITQWEKAQTQCDEAHAQTLVAIHRCEVAEAQMAAVSAQRDKAKTQYDEAYAQELVAIQRRDAEDAQTRREIAQQEAYRNAIHFDPTERDAAHERWKKLKTQLEDATAQASPALAEREIARAVEEIEAARQVEAAARQAAAVQRRAVREAAELVPSAPPTTPRAPAAADPDQDE